MTYQVAVIGATGVVGRELFDVLESRRFPVSELIPFASEKSRGTCLSFQGKEVECRVLERGCFDGVDFAFFDASDEVSKAWVPQAAESGAWVIDNSAAFRMDDDILLLVPEVNGDQFRAKMQTLAGKKPSLRDRVIAGPNCSTAQMVLPLKPIHDRWGIKRIVVSTYQSVSGAGTRALDELRNQTLAELEGRKVDCPSFPHPIAFNCIPQIGRFLSDDSTSEEHKMMTETKKILNAPELKISVTCVRTPSYSCHGEAINVECHREVDVEELKNVLGDFPGLTVERNGYPTGVEKKGQDDVFIGRIRRDPSVDFGLNFWVISDNLRKGAALNAVQIGELVLQNNPR